MKSFCVILALSLASGGYWYLHRPIVYPPGILIADEPTQIDLPNDTPAFQQGPFHLRPLSVFSIDARLLHLKVYRWDRIAALVPVDLALGWGSMSDQRILDQLSISQSTRFYWYEWKNQPPIAQNEIVSHSTNMHIIPATPAIAPQCTSVRIGSLVHLSGDLVEASGPGINSWKSSLSRTDKGNGACELMWVKEMSILNVGLPQDRQVVAKY